MNNWIDPRVQQLWNFSTHVLYILGGFNINTTAFCLGRWSLHLILLKSSMPTQNWTCSLGSGTCWRQGREWRRRLARRERHVVRRWRRRNVVNETSSARWFHRQWRWRQRRNVTAFANGGRHDEVVCKKNSLFRDLQNVPCPELKEVTWLGTSNQSVLIRYSLLCWNVTRRALHS